MSYDAIQASSATGPPLPNAVNTVRQGHGNNSVGKSDAHQRSPAAEASSAEPVDRVSVSVAARELAKTVVDDRPQLQLSADQLSVMSTGDSEAEI